MTKNPWAAAVAWALLIEALVLWPAPPEVLQPLSFIGFDKVVHAALFGVLAVLSARARRAQGRSAWPVVVFVALYGAFTEVEQAFIPSRSMELGDFLADTAGAVIGLGVFAVWAQKRREFVR